VRIGGVAFSDNAGIKARSRLRIDKHRLNRAHSGNAFPLGAVDPSINFSIEVTNLSEFAVTIQEVGILYEGTKKPGTLLSPILLDGGTWPRRLESRMAVSVYAQAPYPMAGLKSDARMHEPPAAK
jgi:hypothetical protein